MCVAFPFGTKTTSTTGRWQRMFCISVYQFVLGYIWVFSIWWKCENFLHTFSRYFSMFCDKSWWKIGNKTVCSKMHTTLHWIKKLFLCKDIHNQNRNEQQRKKSNKNKLTRTKSGDQCAGNWRVYEYCVYGFVYFVYNSFSRSHIRDQHNRQALGQIATESNNISPV